MSAADLLLHLRAAGFDLAADDGKLLVTPGSMLTDDMRASIRTLKPELVALLTEPTSTSDTSGSAALFADGHTSSTCTDCQHLLRHGTCAEPVAAGLLTEAEGFGIVWPPAGYAATCASYSSKPTAPAQDRPYKLTPADAATCHADGWDDAEMARFQARAAALRRRGNADDDADDLAERLTLRDRQQDDRVLCAECSHYRSGRCGNHRAAGLSSAEVGRDMTVMLQRCSGFQTAR